MDQNTIDRLNSISQELNARALALSKAADGRDHALIMSALGVMIEEVRSLEQKVARLDGPKGIGAAGS
ncbi:hypothetical protein [Rhizobium lusitanum]|uniref:Uncharacterized protein n=1 Tax=Rhizobium lusitanum TaxID=293958 RepID=A0A7X0ITL9_9HYPH|nr:hypothetical protein [Rhizobium lusitanum]MBB6486614.1 hypothetical protein [Rhizobium lusitanum]